MAVPKIDIDTEQVAYIRLDKRSIAAGVDFGIDQRSIANVDFGINQIGTADFSCCVNKRSCSVANNGFGSDKRFAV